MKTQEQANYEMKITMLSISNKKAFELLSSCNFDVFSLSIKVWNETNLGGYQLKEKVGEIKSCVEMIVHDICQKACKFNS